ncbi:MAG TPA: hypothetical protein VH024_04225 [Candidatus Angelobacter sp.]|nr:hypothetical protein [Candidatus Angelobacter sp.]
MNGFTDLQIQNGLIELFDPRESALSVLSVVGLGFGFFCKAIFRLHPQLAACPICAQPSFLISLVAANRNELTPNSTRPGIAIHHASPHPPLDHKTHHLPGPTHRSSFVCPIRRPHAGA